jgi:hypothetical protein
VHAPSGTEGALNRVFYYRKPVWNRLRLLALSSLTTTPPEAVDGGSGAVALAPTVVQSAASELGPLLQKLDKEGE